MACTTSFALINNSCTPEQRAMSNGVAQSISSVLRFVAPILMCNLFSYSVNEINLPLNFGLVFFSQALIFFGNAIYS